MALASSFVCLTAILLFLGNGCSPSDVPTALPLLDLSRISLSEELAGPVASSESRLNLAGTSFNPEKVTLDQYNYFSHAIGGRQSAAADSFFAVWNQDSNNLLWIDLALRNRRLLQKSSPFQEITSRAAFSDTNGAVGCFYLGYKNYRRESGGYWWRKADDSRSDLSPIQEIWLDRWLAVVDRTALRPDDGVRRLLPHLESARDMGGPVMECILWITITDCLVGGDHLDNALHTINMAGRIARQINDPYLKTKTEFWLGKVFLARENLDDAQNQFAIAATMAEANEFTWMHKISRNQLAKIYDMRGNYPGVLTLDRANLALAQATEDSVSIPIILMNIAHAHRAMGQLDSCRIVQDEAIRCVRLYPHATIEARLPLMLAEYYAQVGQYAQMDSLLSAALDNPTNQLVAEETIKLHMELIQGGLRQGRPDLVHRSIVQVDSLRNVALAKGKQIAVNYQHDLMFADFYTQQKEYRKAQIHWQRAKKTLAQSESPEATWKLWRSKGLLARKRGDLTSAREAFTVGMKALEGINNPELQAEGRFLLGSALLDEGNFDEALQLFPSRNDALGFGGNFRTELSSRIFRGVAFYQAQDFKQSVLELEEAVAMCSPFSPVDLVARTQLELGKSYLAMGRMGPGEKQLHLAWETLFSSKAEWTHNPGERSYENLRRETAESLMELYLSFPETAPSSDSALATLNLFDGLFEVKKSPDLTHNKWAQSQVVFFMGKNSTYRWDVSEVGIRVTTLPAADELEKLMAPVISDFSHPGRKLSSQPAVRLSETLLSGVEYAWVEGQNLLLVCDGLLGSVPWPALPLPPSFGTQEGTRALNFGPIVYNVKPVRNSYGRPRTSDKGPRRLLALGANDGERSGKDRLQFAEKEAEAICSMWQPDSCTVLTGQDASWGALKQMNLDSYIAIHLASHARVFPGLPQQSYLVLSGPTGQEQFTAGAVADLNLQADLVYLSSCEAAASNGGTVVGGFVQAFLKAGARSVIASSLEVDDRAARFLAGRVYLYWVEGKSLPEALRLGQVDLAGESDIWSHPFYWAFYRIYQ
ncbi:MAG: CHAT domain-containing protein [bacterium]|nr:CHAT domain-containing protein [bacterium]